MKMVLDTLWSYILQALPYIIVFFPLYIAARAVWLKVCRRRVRFWREIGLSALCLYTIFVLTVTVLPEVSTKYGLNIYYPGGGFGAHNATSWNLVPGNFLNYVGNSLQYYGGAALYVSLLGNVCLFVPLGLLAALCYGGAWWKYLAAGAAFSICIEMFQLLLPRATDIDDVICNTAGMLLGYLLGRLCLRLSGRKKPATQKPAEQENSKRVYRCV